MELLSKFNKIRQNLPDYLLFFSAATIITSAVIYYVYALNLASVIIIIAIVGMSFALLKKRLFLPVNNPEKIANIKVKSRFDNYRIYLLYILYFFLLLLDLYILYSSRSDRALISPWQVVDPIFFAIYAAATLALVSILWQKGISSANKLVCLSAHFFLNLSVAAIVYKIGYGFDPFIHQATMELIDKKGVVTPKPFYYLGEYGLIIVLHKLSGLSIYLLNKFLAPVLAAAFLPLAVYRLTIKNLAAPSRILSPLFLLAISFSPFIVSTPQNLSYLFLILTITYGISRKNSLWTLILALATLAVHPLAGMPALAWWLALILSRHSQKIKTSTYKLLRFLLWLGSALCLPAALFVSGGNSFKEISWNLSFALEPIKGLFANLNSAGQENWLLNFVYFFAYNYNLWIVIIIIASLLLFSRHVDRPEFKSIVFINSALALGFIISSQIIFTDLINYEQTNFAGRLLVLITIFFLPLIISACQHLIARILEQPRTTKIIWLTGGVALLSTSLYVSYPRIDKYFNSRGYSTSANDIAAVNWIQNDAKNPYLVLANQQVSVAALKTLGFDHYYQTADGLTYFYPIPTGAKLYQYYLSMVYKNPSRETIAEARALVGVKESYLVVNKYWFQSARIINAAKLNADSWQEINNEVYIFKYLP